MYPVRWIALLAAATLALGALVATGSAQGSTEARSGYTKRQTYSAALRYLRVDLGYEVVEKDPDAAYLIFRYQPPGRRQTTSGSIEIVESRDEVKLLVQLPQMPSYHETVLRDGLLRKLRSEYGDPPRTKRQPDPKPPDDANADRDDEQEPDAPRAGEKPEASPK